MIVDNPGSFPKQDKAVSVLPFISLVAILAAGLVMLYF